jgi:hypothetical protein
LGQSARLLALICCGAAWACGSGESEESEREALEAAEPLYSLSEDASSYRKLLEAIEENGANDGRDHLDQHAISRWVADGTIADHLEFVFDHGDELSTTEFTAADGVGSAVTAARFARIPSNGSFTGPNASSCGSCHDQPRNDGAGRNVANVLQDPAPSTTGNFNVRNTRNINGDPWLQLASTEMTIDLQSLRAQLKAEVQSTGSASSVPLETKGVTFGSLSCAPSDAGVKCDYSQVQGVSYDLVVRSQGWKGNHTTIRAFAEDAFFGEMGMHSDRFAYHVRDAATGDFQPLPNDIQLDPPDVDRDGIQHELSVGDITAMVIYLVGQAPPTDLLRLQREGKLKLAPGDEALIGAGRARFSDVGCDSCHKPALRVDDTVYREPDTRRSAFYDYMLADTNNGYDATAPVSVDLASSKIVEGFLEPVVDARGSHFEVPAFTDLKRHFLGEQLCDQSKRYAPVDGAHRPVQSPLDSQTLLDMSIDTCEFVTADLWGIASTAPYLHDGRAGTLREAIDAHCSSGERKGEADDSCRQFQALPAQGKAELIAFLRSQVMEGEAEEEEEE